MIMTTVMTITMGMPMDTAIRMGTATIITAMDTTATATPPPTSAAPSPSAPR